MIDIGKSWLPFFEIETQKEYYKNLRGFLKEEYATQTIFPPKEDVMNAFKYTDLDDVKVVILGQDPFHGDGQAMGLSFSVHDGVKVPPSLTNIYKEIGREFGIVYPNGTNGNLTKWTKQGVFLLNACLTVRKGQANSHAGKGWEKFTDAAIVELNEHDNPKVFMLWGAYARKKKLLITNPNHCVLESAHPSPLSANNGFFGNNHFIDANNYLKSKGIDSIVW